MWNHRNSEPGFAYGTASNDLPHAAPPGNTAKATPNLRN